MISYSTWLAQTAVAQEASTRIPLVYIVVCGILTLLFLITFSVANDPRSWRRFYQNRFGLPRDQQSVIRNKRIDEKLKRFGIFVAMFIFVADVVLLLLGVTHQYRNQTPDDDLSRMHRDEAKRIRATAPVVPAKN